MFQKILLPLDGSEAAESALPYGEELASRLGSQLVLYHVPGREHQAQERMHRVYLERLAVGVRNNIWKSKAAVTTMVEAGEPRENICNLVEGSGVDLIVMTAVSSSGLKVGRMLGSVADHICRTVPIPVLIIRPQNAQVKGGALQLINHLLVPLDGSELSMQALPIGEELAGGLKAHVTLFQMARMIRLIDDGYGSSLAFANYAEFDANEKARVTAEMADQESKLKAKGLKADYVVTSGVDAASEIIDAEKKAGADLVVMSTHGRSGLSRWVLGNVAERVLRHGETPLLLVHASAG